ncbi:unnamed protein product [Hydatigera taeniaeformis]|uniref:Y+L amino acid transporter 2 n=1 Tax=Hydatigena taeniaeformis TaxID=6205 RepID=A0A0R3X7S1_HYDTA|nr:unnamed protein product [Hydatigera taeniaeformis]
MSGASAGCTGEASVNDGGRVAVKMSKEIGVIQAVSIVFGVIVGSGIFVSPVGVLRYSNSVGLSLIMWIVPGLFSMLGAMAYAELGVRIQKSGGEYAYILEAFGGLPAFIVLWITFVILGGVGCAANSIVFAQYMLQPVYPDCTIPGPTVNMIALCGLMLIFAINCYKVKWATRLAVVFTLGKILALLLIIGFGLYYLGTGHVENFHNAFEGSNVAPGYLALAFYQGFWAFGGCVWKHQRPGVIYISLVLAVGYQFYSDLFALIELAGFAFSFIAALALPIFFPILFLGCDLFILALTIYQQPRESLSNVILMLVAIPIYWFGVSWKNKPKSFQNFIYKGTVLLQKVFACVLVEDELQLDGVDSSFTNGDGNVET